MTRLRVVASRGDSRPPVPHAPARDEALPTILNPVRRAVLGFALLLAAVFASGAAWSRDVTVGTFVTSLSDVNPEDGTFRMAFYVWFEDPAGTFDLYRDLYIVARDVQISEVETEPTPTGGTYTFARIQVYADQEFDFLDFPFDRQRLTLRLESAAPVGQLRLVPDLEGSRASEYLVLRGWSLGGLSLETAEHVYQTDFGYWEGANDSFSRVLLSVDVARERSPVVIDDFLGFTFAFLITALTFVVPCTELGLRVGMTTGSLFASVLNLSRLDDTVGFKPEFGLVDRLAFLIFGAILTALLISLVTHKLAKRWDPERANRLDTGLGAANMLIYFVLIAWTVHVAIR